MFDQTKKKLLVRHNKVAKQLFDKLLISCLIVLFKKNTEQPPEVFYKKWSS